MGPLALAASTGLDPVEHTSGRKNWTFGGEWGHPHNFPRGKPERFLQSRKI